MRKLLAIVPALAMLSGCGDSEDFSVEVQRPIAAVMSPYLSANIDEAKAIFPDISFARTRPADNVLLFTIPGSGSTESTIRLRFEPIRNGEATVVHATVDVPPTKATIEGQRKYLSESKVERLLKSELESTGRALESHGPPNETGFSGQLVGIAIATNPLYLQQALDLKNHPEKLLAALMAFGDSPSSDDARAPDPASAAPMDNPELAARMDDTVHRETEWREEKRIESASAPMDDTGGASTEY
jgi:hypothetical protein